MAVGGGSGDGAGDGAGMGVGPGDIAGTARRVAAAVAEQVPSAAGEPGRFVVAGVPLTAGLASAFVDQTLAAVTARAPELAAVVGQEHQKALRVMSSLRNSRTHAEDGACGVGEGGGGLR